MYISMYLHNYVIIAPNQQTADTTQEIQQVKQNSLQADIQVGTFEYVIVSCNDNPYN